VGLNKAMNDDGDGEGAATRYPYDERHHAHRLLSFHASAITRLGREFTLFRSS
jgi:hypothetical protein